MKAIITVEQFDNGITLKWASQDDVYDPQYIVALDEDRESAIGKMIWDDIRLMMDSNLSNCVSMEIYYTAKKE